MTLTDILRREHDLIERALDVLRAVSDRLGEGTGSEADARVVVAFFREFADGSHHMREERALFPALEAHGIPGEDGPLGAMRREHDHGRRLLAEMDHAIDLGLDHRDARELFRDTARAYAILIGQHVFKETHMLFEMADRVLPPALNEQLGAEQREEHEQQLSGHGEAMSTLARRVLSAA